MSSTTGGILFPYTTLFRSPCTSWTIPETLFPAKVLNPLLSYASQIKDAHCSTCLDQRRLLHQGKQRSEEHTSELQSRRDLVCRLLLEKKKKKKKHIQRTDN